MPTAGQNNDLVYVWGLVEELASQLQANRERFTELEAGIARSQVHTMGGTEAWNTLLHIVRSDLAKALTLSMVTLMVTFIALHSAAYDQKIWRSVERHADCPFAQTTLHKEHRMR